MFIITPFIKGNNLCGKQKTTNKWWFFVLLYFVLFRS
jgi:hypothetical protein